MGFAITWCAVREEHAHELLKQFELTPTGEIEEFPESLISTVRLDTGWTVVVYNKYGCPFMRPQDLAQASRHYDVLMCLVEEHVMVSSSELWSAGHRKWWIEHVGTEGPKGLAMDGALPDCFTAIRSEMEQAQQTEDAGDAEVDYLFEIPLEVAQSIVGFRHDGIGPRYAVLSHSGAKKGFWRRLFTDRI